MKVLLDVSKMKTEAEAHEYMKRQFDFPDWYGNNLDALYDCLTDYQELEAEFYNRDDSGGHIEKIQQVMKDAGVEITEI